jgi:hypothetical protein
VGGCANSFCRLDPVTAPLLVSRAGSNRRSHSVFPGGLPPAVDEQHELVFEILFLGIVAIPLRQGQWWAWWLSWVVLVADLGYTLTFASHVATVFSRALIADIALPVVLLAQLPWLLSKRWRTRVGQ